MNYKKYTCMYDDLLQLAQLMASCSPYRTTRNPYRKLKNKLPILPHLNKKELIELFDLLVHGITKLNQMYRNATEYHIQSSKEDNLVALQLMKKLAFPQASLNDQFTATYTALRTTFNDKPFTRKQVYDKLRHIPPSTIGRHFVELQYAGKLEIVGGNKTKGFIYKTVPVY